MKMDKQQLVRELELLISEDLSDAKLKFARSSRTGEIRLSEITLLGSVKNEEQRRKSIVKARLTFEMSDSLLKEKGLKD